MRRGCALLVAAVALHASAAWQPAEAKFKVLYNFCVQPNCRDGTLPSVLLRDSSNNLYGTTAGGGAFNQGTIFQVSFPGGVLNRKVLYSFCRRANCTDGKNPRAGLIIDTQGNLYGVARDGGASAADGSDGHGTVFELSPPAGAQTNWTFRLLYNFCKDNTPWCPDGEEPQWALTYQGQRTGAPYDGTSPLYGVTQYGGVAHEGVGVVYRLASNSKGGFRETALYGLCAQTFCSDGADPNGPLVMDAAGNLYGAASSGGPADEGVLFKLQPVGNAFNYSVLYSFCQLAKCGDGSIPYSPTFDNDDNLIGTAFAGGPSQDGRGVIYKVVPGTGVESLLYSFCVTQPATCPDGFGPTGTLTTDASGSLFGTTIYGGANDGGIVFRRSQDGSETVLKSFCYGTSCSGGDHPDGGLLFDDAGDLFGTTPDAGVHAGGVLFELTP